MFVAVPDHSICSSLLAALTNLPAGVVHAQMSTLEKWVLNLGFEEGHKHDGCEHGGLPFLQSLTVLLLVVLLLSSAEEMKRGRELQVLGAPPPAVDDILHQSTTASASVSVHEFHQLQSALETAYGGSHATLLAALQPTSEETRDDAAESSGTQTSKAGENLPPA